jgi:hypothetical protein
LKARRACLYVRPRRRPTLPLLLLVIAVVGCGPGSAPAWPGLRRAVNYPAGDGPAAVAIVDLTGDGRADLAVADIASARLSVLAGRGDGSFAPPVSYPVRFGPDTLALGDLNGDGRTDVVVAAGGSGGGGVSVLLARADGALAAAQTYPPREAWSVAAADFNGDGRLDLVAAQGQSSVIWGLFGVGDGTFQPPAKYRVGSFPIELAPVDMNNDQRIDLVISYFVSD